MTKSSSINICLLFIILLFFTAYVAARPDDSSPCDVFDREELDVFSIGQQFVANYLPMSSSVNGHALAVTAPAMASRAMGHPMTRMNLSPVENYQPPTINYNMPLVDDQREQPFYANHLVNYTTGAVPIPSSSPYSPPPPPVLDTRYSQHDLAPGGSEYLHPTFMTELSTMSSAYPADDWTDHFGPFDQQSDSPAPRHVPQVPFSSLSFPADMPLGSMMPPAMPVAHTFPGPNMVDFNMNNDTLASSDHSRLGPDRSRGMSLLTPLDTQFLQPGSATSDDISPSSASTTGSGHIPGSRRRRHKIELASGEHSHVCGECGAGFSTQGDLNHHNKNHEPYARRPHCCRKCAARFRYPKDLARHAITHNTLAPRHLCPVAGCKFATKGFGRPDHLTRHMRTQHKDVPLPSSSASR